MDSRFDIIEVNTSVSNPEYPTRVRIVDFDGNFEHAGAYSSPKFTFSVKVEVEYNKVVDGKEENLVKVTFWTKDDYSLFSFEEDDLDDESVEDWFWEGLSEDLGNHDLEGLENLDLYSMEVPTCEDDELCGSIDSAISDALEKCIPDAWSTFEYECSELYNNGDSFRVPDDWSKNEEVIVGNTRTVWSIVNYELEDGYDEGDVINAIFYVEGTLYVDDKPIFEVDFETGPLYLMEPCNNLQVAAHSLIEKSSLCWLLEQEKLFDLSDVFDSFRSFVEIAFDNDIEDIGEYISSEVYDNFNLHNEVISDAGDIRTISFSTFEQWIEDYNNMDDAQRQAIADGE